MIGAAIYITGVFMALGFCGYRGYFRHTEYGDVPAFIGSFFWPIVLAGLAVGFPVFFAGKSCIRFGERLSEVETRRAKRRAARAPVPNPPHDPGCPACTKGAYR